jgi:hypothetical protein
MPHLRVSVRALADAKPIPIFRRGRNRRLMEKRTLLTESVVGVDNVVNDITDLVETATDNLTFNKLIIFLVCSVSFFYNFDAIGPYLTLYFLKCTNSYNVSISIY